ncbi:MAG: class I SAM-dependent methyltransferase [Acidimicrobiales bacterium]
MNAVRSHPDVIAEHVALAGATVIDVGCGAGVLSRALRARGADVWGVECSAALLERARAADPDHADRYVEGVGQSLPFVSGFADAVVYSYALHHVPEDLMGAALDEAARVLRSEGILYVVEPEAAGPSFEVVRIVDDETGVRAAAQRALLGVAAHGFVPRATFAYTSELVHADLQSMIDRVLGGDGARAAALEAQREEFTRRFFAHGRPVPGGFAFSQANLVAVFERCG